MSSVIFTDLALSIGQRMQILKTMDITIQNLNDENTIMNCIETGAFNKTKYGNNYPSIETIFRVFVKNKVINI